MSQSQLGLKFNLGKTTISHYENFERDIPSDLIVKFSEFFQVTTDYFLGVDDTETEKYDTNKQLILSAVKKLDFSKFTNSELLEYEELLKENAMQIQSRHRESPFMSSVRVAEVPDYHKNSK